MTPFLKPQKEFRVTGIPGPPCSRSGHISHSMVAHFPLLLHYLGGKRLSKRVAQPRLAKVMQISQGQMRSDEVNQGQARSELLNWWSLCSHPLSTSFLPPRLPPSVRICVCCICVLHVCSGECCTCVWWVGVCCTCVYVVCVAHVYFE